MANPVSAQVAVTTLPTLLWQTVESGANAANQTFQAGTVNDPPTILLVNSGSANCYLGGSGVSISTGAVLAANGSIAYNPVGNGALYGVAASNSTVTIGVVYGAH